MTINELRMILTADSGPLMRALNASGRRVTGWGKGVRGEIDKIRQSTRSLAGVIGSVGAGYIAMNLVKQSSQLDKTLTQIGLTANESGKNVGMLRGELFRMATETGRTVEDLQAGFNNAVQAGLTFKEALPVMDGVNKAMAVTGANAESLTSALTVASSVFKFDLASPGQALTVLDKMRVAGKLGNAEMENLASIFPRVGFTAKRAGMSFEQTLGFVEALSQAEKNPERLGTLSVSFLRMFTNAKYMEKVTEATGVKFFKNGARKDAIDVFGEIKTKFDALKTDIQRHNFISAMLEGADTETVTGAVAFLQGDYLKNAKKFADEITNGAGTIKKELPDAINNATDQVGRLSATLRKAADNFTKPLRDGVTKTIKYILDSEKQGGMELTGESMIGGGAVALAGSYLLYRGGSMAARSILGRVGATAGGIAAGKALESTTGVTPVFVTNMPAGGMIPAGVPGIPARAGTGAAATFAKTAALIAPPVAGALATYEFNKYADRADVRRESMDRLAQAAAVDRRTRDATTNVINMKVNIDQAGRATTTSDNTNTKINLQRGTFFTPWGSPAR